MDLNLNFSECIDTLQCTKEASVRDIEKVTDSLYVLLQEYRDCCSAVSFNPGKDELLSVFLQSWVTKNAELTEIAALKEEIRILKLGKES